MFITIDDLKTKGRYKEQRLKMADNDLNDLLDRIDIYIESRTGCSKLEETDDPKIKKRLAIASIGVADYLYFVDNVMKIEQNMMGVKSENIGDYSYSLSDGGIDYSKIGNPEIDSILDGLSCKSESVFAFSISHPEKHRWGKRW